MPLVELMTLKATMGEAAFNSEYQSSPIDPSMVEWPESYFSYPGFFFDLWPQTLDLKTLALDPSKGRDAKHGDYSAFVKLGRDPAGVLYVEADLRRIPSDIIVQLAVEHVRQFQPDGFAIETNQFQELFVALFLSAVDANNPQALAPGLHLPLYEIDNRVNKEVRIRRIGPYLAQRLLRFKTNSPGTKLLIDQLRDFPHGSFDDACDSLEMGIRLAVQLWNQGA